MSYIILYTIFISTCLLYPYYVYVRILVYAQVGLQDVNIFHFPFFETHKN